MAEVSCPVCNKTRFYYNTEGITIKGKCKECGVDIMIPFKSARTEGIEMEDCPKCGHENKILHILPKRSLSVQSGYRGGSVKMYHGTPEKYERGVCEKCGADLGRKRR